MESPSKPSLIDRIAALLLREPEDREDLLALLHAALDRDLLDADALSCIIDGTRARGYGFFSLDAFAR